MWRRGPQEEFHDGDPKGSMITLECSLIQEFSGVKIDAHEIMSQENFRHFGLESEAPWTWSVDFGSCGLSKEILVIFLISCLCFPDKDEWAFMLESVRVQEKVLEGFRKRKREEDDEDVIVIDSPPTNSGGAIAGESEALSEKDSGEVVQSLSRRPRRSSARALATAMPDDAPIQ